MPTTNCLLDLQVQIDDVTALLNLLNKSWSISEIICNYFIVSYKSDLMVFNFLLIFYTIIKLLKTHHLTFGYNHFRCSGLKMLAAIDEINQEADFNVSIRVGIHTGSVLCGVVGIKRFRWALGKRTKQHYIQISFGDEQHYIQVSFGN